jgi:uncharacterized protein (TIGR02594 family)
MNLPALFAYLGGEAGPKVLLNAVADYGVKEVPGPASHPRIMEMAREVGATSYYPSDATPWCALAMAAWVKAAGFKLPPDPLRALSWATFGSPAPGGVAMLGDVLVKSRVGGGHVGLYVGENKTHYAVLGGNQGDSVSIAWFPKNVFSHVRRCPWKIAQPANVRRITVAATAGATVKQS